MGTNSYCYFFYKMFRQFRGIKRSYRINKSLEKFDFHSSLKRVADLYYDIESNIYKMESVIQENDTSSLKQFLLSENARIQAELLQMKPAELAIASSAMTKPLLLSDVRVNALLEINLQKLNLLPRYEKFEASLSPAFDRFHVKRFQAALLSLKEESQPKQKTVPNHLYKAERVSREAGLDAFER